MTGDWLRFAADGWSELMRPGPGGAPGAAAVPLGALTARQALHQHARLRPGRHVLVHGGAGGAGAYAVQLAALHDARVTATASARNLPSAAGPGAHDVRDHAGRLEGHVDDADVVTGPVGGTTSARSWPVLTSAARTSSSGPAAASLANWPNWPAAGSCARPSRRSSTWAPGQKPSRPSAPPGPPAR
jgi:NADPH:quinone reductase-like Zn-dependent oxidoreductase